MPETALKIPQQSFADIAEVIVNVDRLTQIVTLSDSASLQHDISSIAKAVVTATQIPDGSTRRILSALAIFRSLMERNGLTTESLIERLTESLASQAPVKWKDQYFDRWQASSSLVANALHAMSSEHPLVVLQKVQEPACTRHHEEDLKTEFVHAPSPVAGEEAWIARRMWISETLLLRVVEVNEGIRGGIPLLRGTRMTVAQLIGELADGRSLPDIAENFEIDAGDFRSLLEGIAVQFDRPFK